MNKFMKKAFSLMLVLMMLVTSVTVYATEPELGAYDNPYQLSTTSFRFAVSVEPGTEAWVQVDDCNGSTATVGYATGSDYMIVYCRQPHYPETESGDNTLSFSMVDGADMFSVYNSGEELVVVYMSLTAGAPGGTTGTVENPEEVTLAPNMFGGVGAYVTKDLEEGNEGYYFTCTAPDNGIITVQIDAFDDEYNSIGWYYFVNNVTAGKYGDSHWSDDDEPAYYEDWNVSKDDVLVVFASTYDPNNMFANPAGTVSVNFSFSAIGSWSNPEEIVAGEYAPELVEGSQGYYYTWTAPEDGTATVAMDTENNPNGWQYCVNGEMADGSYLYGDTHWNDDDPVVPFEEISVKAGDILSIFVNTYDPNSFAAPAGTVNWSLSFVPGSVGEGGEGGDGGEGEGGEGEGGDIGGGEEDVNYIVSDLYLELGTHEYPVSPLYTYTIFMFEPQEVGKYTISSIDSVMGAASYNGMWVTIVPSAETVSETELEWECSAVGQSIWVAVLADTNIATITVSREELDLEEEVEWTVYENQVTPENFEFTGDEENLEPVDTFDETEDKAVLGDDGFYHLNSADGPILYADLNDTLLSLIDAASYGQLNDYNYENDELVSKIDYNEALAEYAECADPETGLYPLTVDLMEIYKNVGDFKSWYGENGPVGGTESDAWMFACYYDTSDDGADVPPTGDNTVIYVCLLAVSAIGIYALTSEIKKRVR